MQNRSYLFPVFLLCLAVAFFLIFLSNLGFLNFFTNDVQMAFFPLNIMLTKQFVMSQKDTQLSELQKENAQLRGKLVQLSSLQEDNKALRDQFTSNNPPSTQLLPVEVVGKPQVIINVNFPETLIINAGKKEGVHNGSVVVSGTSVVGIINNANDQYSLVQLVSNVSMTIPVKIAETGAIGILKGQGSGDMIVDNIVLSDTVSMGNTVITLGSQDLSGKGFPPGLIIGKVSSVEKNPSSLFQKAKVSSSLQFDRLTSVFVME